MQKLWFYMLLSFFSLLFFIMVITRVSENYVIDFGRTLTKAVCSGKTCRDFLVTCSGSEVLDLKPISGFVTFGDGWVDKRKEKGLC